MSSFDTNASSCAACHMVPDLGGSSKLTVTRAGHMDNGHFVQAPHGGILHASNPGAASTTEPITGLRVATNLLGVAYVEAVPDEELHAIAVSQAKESRGKIHGQLLPATDLESPVTPKHAGRFGWKDQHASLRSFVSDSLANELGVPSRLYPLLEYTSAPASDDKSLAAADVEITELVTYLRSRPPVPRDPETIKAPDVKQGEHLFAQLGCAVCHRPTLTTGPKGSRLTTGEPVPPALANQPFHPYSDYLLHDIGTGDGIVQYAAIADADPATANKFRTAPLWGVRYRSWMMHDGKSVTYHQAIERHNGEAESARIRYEALSPAEQHALRAFLNSL